MIKRFLPLLILLTAGPLSVHAQSDWTHELRSAAISGKDDQISELIAAQRIDVSRVIRDLINEGLRSPSGPGLNAAARIADVYADRFDEHAHQKRVEFARTLDEVGAARKLKADSLYQEAYDRRSSSDTRETARDLYLQALSIYQEIGDLSGRAETNGQLGYVSFWLDKDAYLTYNEKALELRRELGDLKLIGNSLNDVGVYLISRDAEAALPNFLESERIRWAIGDSLVLSAMLPRIGLTFEALGDYDSAATYYDKAAYLYLAVGDTAKYISQRNNAAGLLTDYLERHSDALVEMLDLREELRAIDDPETEARVSNSLGVVSRRLGDYESAIAYYQEVVALSQEHGFDDLLAGALNNIGVVYIWIGRPERAVSFFERSLEMSRAAGRQDGTIDALVNLGSAQYEIGEWQASMNRLKEAESVASEVGDELSLGTIHTGLGNALLKSGGPEQAATEYRMALDIANTFDVPDLLMGVQFGLGDVAEHLDRPNDALEWYKKAIAMMENSRGLLHASEDKAGYLAQTRYLFEDVIDFLAREAIDTGDASWIRESFDVSEQAKARAFVDQLAEAIAGVRRGVDPELLSDQEILTDNLVYLRGQLALTDDADDRATIKAQIREQEIEFDRVERNLRENNPAYAELRYPDPVDLTAFQSTLEAGDLALVYSVGDSSSTLWTISPTQANVHVLPVRDEIKSRVDVLRFALQDPARSTSTQYGDAAGGLFDMIAGPARTEILSADHLIIIPDDVLNYVPFEALVVEQGDTYSSHDYLVRSAPISYVQSASVWVQLTNRPHLAPDRALLAVGNPDFGATNQLSALRGAALQPLPFSGEEVDAISGLFDANQVTTFTGSGATESAVRTSLDSNRYRFVHFATHGLINDNRPDFSALALSRGETRGEGLLQAGEIFDLSLPAELVVLSACETGLGQLIQGEGMIGLTRAFMYAGAASIVASLWSVADESTARLMQEMYVRIVESGDSPRDALRKAKLVLLTAPETAHPFFWAPFVLFGHSR